MAAPDGAVVVGLDGGDIGLLAADWAADEAARRGVPVHLVHAMGPGFGELPPPSAQLNRMQAGAQEILDRGVARIGRRGVPVSAEVVDVAPYPALQDASTRAGLTVVGAVGHGRMHDAVLGSVSVHLSHHAASDVVVVREQADPDARRVVVGVDGSAGGERALRFAFDAALRRGAPLTALHCWTEHRHTNLAVGARDVGAGVGAHDRLLHDAVDPWARKFPAVDVDPQLAAVRPADALVEASAHGALVVVGARGSGGFAGLHVGAVAQSVLHHARCPVAVVRR